MSTINRPTGLDTPTKRAQWVLETITAYPDLHDQMSWVDEGDCGTTRCVGGWTLYAANIPEDITGRIGGGDFRSSADMAGDLLNLSPADADRLFYYTNDEEAVLALQDLVAGKPIDWKGIGEQVTGEDHFPSDDEYSSGDVQVIDP